ncbi:MAG: hypothetical protein CR986_02715 [Ignavibacteriae bacterium]|nr:MAG: hypothetical protein CR986_02715 [Ignavibacteriota bacterium]
MKKCIVVGGGLAGISASVYLKNLGYDIELLEASPKLGGRTYSFFHNKTKTEVDNGQHLMIGAYEETIALLKIIHAQNIPEYQKYLNVAFLDKYKKKYYLNAKNKIYPFNLLRAILNYKRLNLKEKISVIKFLLKNFLSKKDLTNKTVSNLLLENNQSENVIKSLWELIGVGALNTKLEKASAEIFSILLNRIFFSGNKASTFVFTSKPLNKLFVEPVKRYFKENNIKLSLSERVNKIEIHNNKVSIIKTNRRIITDFDKIIFAVPAFAIKKIVSNQKILPDDILNLEASPIITIHIWTDKKLFNERVIGFIDSQIDWIFNNVSHYSVIISAADNLLKKNNNEIIGIVKSELNQFLLNFKDVKILNFLIIKEKRAAHLSTPKNEKLRKEIESKIENLFFAGDWINTGLPSTIESAILSGRLLKKRIEEEYSFT